MPMKMAKATATQNSAVNIVVSSALERGRDRAGDPLPVGRLSDQPLDDRGGGLGRDAVDLRHGGRPLRGNGLLGLSDARVERDIKLLAARVCLRGMLPAG